MALVGGWGWRMLTESKIPYRGPMCLSNVKHMATALKMYQTDFEDHFPPRDRWIDASLPYTRDPSIFRCPQMMNSWGYAFNGALDRRRMPAAPSRVPLVYDSVAPVKNASDLFKSLPATSRHHGKNNVGYADGHTAAVAP